MLTKDFIEELRRFRDTNCSILCWQRFLSVLYKLRLAEYRHLARRRQPSSWFVQYAPTGGEQLKKIYKKHELNIEE